MQDANLFNRYAIALLELSIEKGEVKEYRKEVKLIKDLLHENKEFSLVLDDIYKNNDEKFALVDKIFATFIEDIRNFIKTIIKNKRCFYLYEIFKEALFRFDDYLNIEEGTLYIAKEMDEKEIQKIISAIEEKEKVNLELEIVIDPSIIGGFIVSIKNNVYDSSVITKLENLKSSLTK